MNFKKKCFITIALAQITFPITTVNNMLKVHPHSEEEWVTILSCALPKNENKALYLTMMLDNQKHTLGIPAKHIKQDNLFFTTLQDYKNATLHDQITLKNDIMNFLKSYYQEKKIRSAYNIGANVFLTTAYFFLSFFFISPFMQKITKTEGIISFCFFFMGIASCAALYNDCTLSGLNKVKEFLNMYEQYQDSLEIITEEEV
jgi:hypothetical protein